MRASVFCLLFTRQLKSTKPFDSRIYRIKAINSESAHEVVHYEFC